MDTKSSTVFILKDVDNSNSKPNLVAILLISSFDKFVNPAKWTNLTCKSDKLY